jgi:hypothetical protein
MTSAARQRLAETLGEEAAPSASSVQQEARADDLHLEVAELAASIFLCARNRPASSASSASRRHSDGARKR